MLLRIIDVPANESAENSEDAIRVVLENNGNAESFATESYTSPVYESFYQTLAWYFSDYPLKGHPQNSEKVIDDSGVAEKIIQFGQYIGDELLGENYQLIKLKESIEDQGYENLQVQIESARVEFFKELWETAILHESKYVLSTVVKGYMRQFVQKSDYSKDDLPNSDLLKEFSELRYDLKTIPATQNQVTQLLQGDTPQSSNKKYFNSEHQKKDQPLRVLYLISRPNACDLSFDSSNVINLSLKAIASGGVIDYELYQTYSWEELKNRLADKRKPVHIFHYDGPVILDNDEAYFSLADRLNNRVSVSDLSGALANNKVAVLSVDARAYLHDKQPISASLGLATIARSAYQHGLGNVIGLGQVTTPWIGAECFETIYWQITKGLSLAQAVVEARKTLQSHIESDLMTVNAIPFHPWSLLVHYGKQSVIFFESPQTLTDKDAIQQTEIFREKLFGFKTEMLPPVLKQVGDGQVLQLIGQLENAQRSNANQSALIVGEKGTGKTQLAHVLSLYFAQTQQIDYGFYFDFGSNDYLPNDMLEMIAPLLTENLQSSNNSNEETEQNLIRSHCCFILDNVCSSQRNVEKTAGESKTSEYWNTLKVFLNNLLSHGHKIVVLGESYSALNFSTLDELATVKIETTPLPIAEQNIMVAESLRQLHFVGAKLTTDKLTEISGHKDWGSLLLTLKGHPWLIRKVIPLLQSLDVTELKNQLKKHINDKHKNSQALSSKIMLFYQWQWNGLKPFWQRLLILCSETRGLLLEMLMAATDQKASFAPAKFLFSLLAEGTIGDEFDENETNFSEGLDLWETAGFLTRLPHGRMIDSKCLSFLAANRENCGLNDIDQEKLQLLYSQVICEGIRLLAQHLVKQPNSNISNNLLINRRYWVKHFENLWFSRDYRGFFGVKNAFDQLLQQVKLGGESRAWSLNLLERSPFVSCIDKADPEESCSADAVLNEKVSWLVLASSVMGEPEAKNSECLKKGAKAWRTWFNTLAETIDKQQLALFQQVTTFLEYYYQCQSSWKDCIVISEKTLTVYTQYEAWQGVIQSLKSLAKYYHELGDDGQALVFENKIINDISYADSPPGFKTQQILDVLFIRTSRGDTQHSQSLLNELRESEEAGKFANILDGIQCDIHFQNEDYPASLPYYCKIWVHALKSNQQVQIEQLKTRLIELEQKLGLEFFNQQFERVVPEGTIRPHDYVN